MPRTWGRSYDAFTSQAKTRPLRLWHTNYSKRRYSVGERNTTGCYTAGTVHEVILSQCVRCLSRAYFLGDFPPNCPELMRSPKTPGRNGGKREQKMKGITPKSSWVRGGPKNRTGISMSLNILCQICSNHHNSWNYAIYDQNTWILLNLH